jgi:hypothetical protein
MFIRPLSFFDEIMLSARWFGRATNMNRKPCHLPTCSLRRDVHGRGVTERKATVVFAVHLVLGFVDWYAAELVELDCSRVVFFVKLGKEAVNEIDPLC